MRKPREWPRWAKVLWCAAWGIGVVGLIIAALMPSYIALSWIVRIYLGVWAFICGMIGFSLSFSSDFQALEQVPNLRVLLRGVGVVGMAGAIFYFCTLIVLRNQLHWR